MKKHFIAILIITLILAIAGTSVYFIVKHSKPTPLYKANSSFILDEDTTSLTSKITQAQTLYAKEVSGDTRLLVLHNAINKLDTFELDLNSYLVLNTVKAKSTKKLSKMYSNLNSSRNTLIKNYDEYITRMSGNLNADGNAIQKLYNDIFNKTVAYLYDYNTCFIQTSNFVFSKVYKAGTIKTELYTLYSLSVNNLLNNIKNNQFENTSLITRLNNGINLNNNNIVIVASVNGGEYSTQALNFKKYFNSSNLTVLVENFNTYYNASINVDTETSSEKLAVYYAKQILGL